MRELNTYYIPTRSGNSCLCYLKSDADKVIAEKDAKIHELENMPNTDNEKGVKNSRKKAMAYYYAHKDDPEFKAKRAARQRKYRADAKAKKKLPMADGNIAA